jgi:uroporphyrin-III C-methyltransferase/precorrin-2 dehydrogenase/sirohydrochlorin ferrochelatase
MYPVMLNVRDRPCLVVGGGGVALRKVEGLLGEGARVTVVAPQPTAGLEQRAAEGRIVLEHRAYRPGEATAYSVVFAATDEREVNRRVFEDAKSANVWVNVADDPDLCTFHLPSRVQRGTLGLAIASAGEAPFVVRRLRQVLERRFGPEWSEWIEAAARFRRAVRQLGLDLAEQERRYDAFFSATVDGDRLSARVPTVGEAEALARGGLAAPASATAQATTRDGAAAAEKPVGLVSLVGAGPGDPLLLTLRARQRLLAADAVVCDRLALTALPCDLPASVHIHPVGKEAGNHPVPQAEICALLVRLARAGSRVVRLKGGDPYVFGRGGEEAMALTEAGIPFEVVPGVTAGIAVPAYAGIPVTHRREAVRVTLVTAHEAKKSDGPQVRWDLIAADPHATLVGYMGVTALPTTVRALLAAGMDPSTPAALVHWGSTSAQRTLRAPLSRLPEAAAHAELGPPALFIIGPTVALAESLDWLARGPLAGRRVLMVGPPDERAETLDLGGAEVVVVPEPLTPAAQLVIGALPVTDCILRHPHDAEILDEERDGPGWSPRVVTWCLGPEASERARLLGWQNVEQLDRSISAEQLAEAMGRPKARFRMGLADA